MNTRLLSRLAVFALVVLVLVSVLTAAAAANFVPVTRADDLNLGERTADQLKPTGCPYILTDIFICPNSTNKHCDATAANELVLARPDTNQIDGGGGVDCCVGVPGVPGTKFNNCAWHTPP